MNKQTEKIIQHLFELISNGSSPQVIAKLFSEDVDFLISGDTKSVPWIGKKTGKTGVASFYEGINQYIDSLEFEIEDILIKNQRGIVLGYLVSRVRKTGKLIKTEFAFDIIIEDKLITRFRMFEDSFAVSEAVR